MAPEKSPGGVAPLPMLFTSASHRKGEPVDQGFPWRAFFWLSAPGFTTASFDCTYDNRCKVPCYSLASV